MRTISKNRIGNIRGGKGMHYQTERHISVDGVTMAGHTNSCTIAKDVGGIPKGSILNQRRK